MLVIHIGPRKTATTYLQSNFYRSRKELLAKGWLYPVLSLKARNAHHGVVSGLAGIRKGEGALVRSIAKAGRVARKRGANILISSESFRRWSAEDFVTLGERFGQSEVVIVYALRDPADLLLSVWGETVKNGRAASLKHYVRKHLSDPEGSAVLNCLNELGPITDHPKLSLKVINFEALRKSGEDVFTAFCREILGLPDSKPAEERLRNPSFSPEINDFLRLIAKQTDYDPKGSELLFSRRFSRTHDAAEQARITETISRLGAGMREDVVIDRDASWYAGLEAKVYARLGSVIVPQPAQPELFKRGTVRSYSYDIDALAAVPEIASLVETSIARMKTSRQRFGRTPVAAAWRYVRRLFSV